MHLARCIKLGDVLRSRTQHARLSNCKQVASFTDLSVPGVQAPMVIYRCHILAQSKSACWRLLNSKTFVTAGLLYAGAAVDKAGGVVSTVVHV